MTEPLEDLSDVEPLTGEVEVERVITDEDSRLFSARGCFFSRKSLREFLRDFHLPEDMELTFENPTRVTGQNGVTIGFASCAWEGELFLVTVTLPYNSTYRLAIENGDKLYASPTLQQESEKEIRLISFFLTFSKSEDGDETSLVAIVE